MELEVHDEVGFPHRCLLITDSHSQRPRRAGCGLSSMQGREDAGPLFHGHLVPDLHTGPLPRSSFLPQESQAPPGIPMQNQKGKVSCQVPTGFCGEEEPAGSFCGTEAFPWGAHLRPAALGSAESQPFCGAVCDPVRLNCNSGLWPDSLAVCFTNSYLRSQIRLIKKPAPHGAINDTRTSRVSLRGWLVI